MDSLSKLLKNMVALGASDLLITPGRAPGFRVKGKLLPPEGPPLTAEKIERMARLLMLDDQYQDFQRSPEINLGFSLPDIGRFRINIFQQRRALAMAIRAIPTAIPSMTTLGLPEALKSAALMRSGLILVVGPAGTGKSTTLASMIDWRNQNDLGHIITIEDPIEYLFDHKGCMVNQREIGIDTQSYSQALLNVLRQSPDVVMVGEVRTLDVLEQLFDFADTGHLCLTTLHAANVVQALDRMIKMFPEEAREQARITLGQNVRAILSQRLVMGVDGELHLAYELLTATARTADLIYRGEFATLHETMERDSSGAMQTMDRALLNLMKSGRISESTAMQHASSITNLRVAMRLANPTVQ